MTAVEWFKQQISTCSLNEIDDNINHWFEQAKQMEKEQIEEAFINGRLPQFFTNLNEEEYYNQRYKNK